MKAAAASNDNGKQVNRGVVPQQGPLKVDVVGTFSFVCCCCSAWMARFDEMCGASNVYVNKTRAKVN